jgi:hypothetical protein
VSLGYKFVLQENAFQFAISRRTAERERLRSFFRTLAADPYREGDFHELDDEGRRTEVVLLGTLLITYWTDHAVKEVRITRIEIVKYPRSS